MISSLRLPSLMSFGAAAAVLLASGTHGATIDGFTEPQIEAELAAAEPGIVAKVLVREGERVSQGQLVAELDTSVLQRRLAIARQRSTSVGTLNAAKHELELQSQRFHQIQQLFDNGNATRSELDRAKTDKQIARERVVSAEEDLRLSKLECELIEAQIQRRLIRSPLDGVVSEVFKEVGEAIVSQDPRILTIVCLDRLRGNLSATPLDVARIKKGQIVNVTFPHLSQETKAKVENISPVMDAKSGTVKITVSIENQDLKFRSGAHFLVKLGGNDGHRTREVSVKRK